MISYITYGISLTIFILNNAATDLIPTLVNMEKHVSQSNRIISTTTK